jgi:hypothetical protein
VNTFNADCATEGQIFYRTRGGTIKHLCIAEAVNTSRRATRQEEPLGIVVLETINVYPLVSFSSTDKDSEKELNWTR